MRCVHQVIHATQLHQGRWPLPLCNGLNRNMNEFYPLIYDLVVHLLTAGPGSTHIELIREIFRRFEMKEYMEDKLDSEQLKKLLRILMREFIPEKHVETTDDFYSSWVSDLLRNYIFDYISETQYRNVLTETTELYVYYQRKSNDSNLSSDMASVYQDVCRLLDRELEDEIQAEILKQPGDPFNIEGIIKIIQDEKFIEDEDKVENVIDQIKSYIKSALSSKEICLKQIATVFRLLEVAVDHEPTKLAKDLLDSVTTFYRRLDSDELRPYIQDNEQLFEEYIQKMTDLGHSLKNYRLLAKVIARYTDFLDAACKVSHGNKEQNKKVQRLWASYMGMLVTKPKKEIASACDRMIEHYKDMMRWKDDVEGARPVFDGMIALATSAYKNLTPDELEHEDFWTASSIADFIEDFLESLQSSRVVNHYQEEIFRFSLESLKSGSPYLINIARETCEFVDLKKHKHFIKDVVTTLARLIKEDFDFEIGWCHKVVSHLLDAVFKVCEDGTELMAYSESFTYIYEQCLTRDYMDYSSGNKNTYGLLTLQCLPVYTSKHAQSCTLQVLEPLFGHIVKLLNDEDEDLSNCMKTVLELISRTQPVILAKILNEIIGLVIVDEKTDLFGVIAAVYPECPKPVEAKLDELQAVAKGDCRQYWAILLNAIASENPSIIKEEMIDQIMKHDFNDPSRFGSAIMVLNTLAQKDPSPISPSAVDIITKEIGASQVKSAMLPYMLASIVKNSKKRPSPVAEKVFNALIDWVKKNTDDAQTCVTGIGAVGQFGVEYKALLTRERNLFEALAKKHGGLAQAVEHIINIIEGRSLGNIVKTVEKHQEDIDDLDTRVTTAENNVDQLTEDVDKTKEEVDKLAVAAIVADERLDNLDDKVDELDEKVEEIDMKTVSNAPAWSKQVSTLLNPEAEHDWRLLAQRLGYNPTDIRGWATQNDPCMSLLSEWFATHKTSEASHAVLEILVEIDRLDAAIVIEEALKNVEDVVTEEAPEYASPPPVFLSYQWSHQPEVKLLRKHLLMAGFQCWMDIGQMGGGDKLYAKIDEGIRAAKVVVCCVTEKYAKSPNCIREVNLAVNLGKPIIPILLERVQWPPAGSMGPIFGEYLYISMHLRKGSLGRGERNWHDEKFSELLMQLSFNKIMPEEEIVDPEYRNWWEPEPEEIILPIREDQKTKSNQITSPAESPPEAAQVFISYQWGKQPQIKRLYRRLTELGFHCWMDIYQMGGGDSLYDKIDRGIRNCRVVVSCVTETYSKSANCRKEVSLCDALKKPIIPLLLEDTRWPPGGPMSMVFTELLYIDFAHEENVQETWTGNSFDQLFEKLRIYADDPQDSSAAVDEKTDAKNDAQDSKAPLEESTDNPEPSVTEESKESPIVSKPREAMAVTEPEATNPSTKGPVKEKPEESHDMDNDKLLETPQFNNVSSNNAQQNNVKQPAPPKQNDPPKKSKTCNIL
ncbi:uncharacterized protein LOC141912910 isoform X2 [Tubulanus polymorphus]|uniref:uncharacterized protein LOC141912910 isoform X2 n=1 Tax=Tubulanus polymorphus TaxID=672921 RepID=UPI003DA66C9B